MGDAGGEHARLAGASTRKYQNGAVDGLDRLALFGVEAGKVVRCPLRVAGRHGARGDAGATCRLGRGGGLGAELRVFIEEGNVVVTADHAAQCSDSGPKDQFSVLLLFHREKDWQEDCGKRCRLRALRAPRRTRDPRAIAAPLPVGWSCQRARRWRAVRHIVHPSCLWPWRRRCGSGRSKCSRW